MEWASLYSHARGSVKHEIEWLNTELPVKISWQEILNSTYYKIILKKCFPRTLRTSKRLVLFFSYLLYLYEDRKFTLKHMEYICNWEQFYEGRLDHPAARQRPPQPTDP